MKAQKRSAMPVTTPAVITISTNNPHTISTGASGLENCAAWATAPL